MQILRLLLAATFSAFLLTGCFDTTVDGDYSPGVSDNSAPAGVSSYSVGGDVSGTIGNITVDKVGALTAAQISNAVTPLSNATHLATPSTLVQRDASGNFAGATITATTFQGDLTGTANSALNSAGYALGRLATSSITLLAFPTTPPTLNGGNVFNVVSAGVDLTGDTFPNLPAGASNGGLVTFIFPGTQVRIVPGPKLRLRNQQTTPVARTYRTVPTANEVFQFVRVTSSPLLWVEVSRSVTVSHVEAVRTVAADFLDSGTDQQDLVFDTKVQDFLGSEFTAATGVFRASQGGDYRMTARVGTNSVDWTEGDTCTMELLVNGVVKVEETTTMPTVGAAPGLPCRVAVDSTQPLNPDDQMKVRLTITRANFGADVLLPAGEPNRQHIEVTRIN